MPTAFHIQPADTVATLLETAEAGAVITVLGAMPQSVSALERIEAGHKVALVAHAVEAAVLKFGLRIGHAVQPIAPGAWVHLHNLASDLDERSGTLDLHSGAPTDSISAYV